MTIRITSYNVCYTKLLRKIFDKSKYYQTKALNFSYKLHDSSSIGYLLNDLGSTYLNLQEKDSALFNFNKAEKIALKLNDVELEYYINNNLCDFHINEQNYSQALKYARIAYKKAMEIKKPYSECHVLNTRNNFV